MASVSGTWYYNNDSTAFAARLEIVDQHVIVRLDEDRLDTPRAQVDISPRLGNTPRRIAFPDGGLFETRDNDALDALLLASGGAQTDWRYWVESRWFVGIAMLVPAALFLWWIAVAGVPALSGLVARQLPASVTEALGEHVTEAMEYIEFEATTLPVQRRAELRSRFDAMVAVSGLGASCELRFYATRRIGPNAFAIPPCIIAVTDELVELAESDDEIAAVLAHELGHVHHRHALRHLVQGALLSFVVVAITGDATQIPALVAAAPALLLELRFSRDFEREADRFAYEFMRDNGIPLQAFADILDRMSDPDDAELPADGWSKYLATHPATGERTELFRE